MGKTHKLAILCNIVECCTNKSNGLTASDFKCSNANQYLGKLEKSGLIKREWKQTENHRFKVAYIPRELRDKNYKIYQNALDELYKTFKENGLKK